MRAIILNSRNWRIWSVQLQGRNDKEREAEIRRYLAPVAVEALPVDWYGHRVFIDSQAWLNEATSLTQPFTELEGLEDQPLLGLVMLTGRHSISGAMAPATLTFEALRRSVSFQRNPDRLRQQIKVG
ncbi:hypothetical protein VRRI112168_02485 [Vreelandella rituensis]|uniref:Uncharacterized protein n=1 Tax=Vreelandella rituensis TaxID=2282306 RepID=A0A368U9N1_9GAMM|nr:hypothetical protein [Halomonas rituensis]RCV93611.1 hypothetical protein DU506_00205 [Halomonas rituensis]